MTYTTILSLNGVKYLVGLDYPATAGIKKKKNAIHVYRPYALFYGLSTITATIMHIRAYIMLLFYDAMYVYVCVRASCVSVGLQCCM